MSMGHVLPDPDTGPFDPADVERVARGLTKARRNMMRNCQLGYIDDDGMDGPGRRMMYALIEMGLLRGVRPLEDRHTQASYIATALGRDVRTMIIAKDLK